MSFAEITFEHLDKKIKSGERVSLSRWGDGEFNCMQYKKGHNCDGHQYFSLMGDYLNGIVLKEQRYFMAAGRLWPRENFPTIAWSNARIFVEQYLINNINQVLEQWQPFTIIGNKQFSNFKDHIVIPEKDCWLEIGRILEQARESKNELIICCAGMASNVIVDQLCEEKSVIDMGSIFDPFFGKKTRSYQ